MLKHSIPGADLSCYQQQQHYYDLYSFQSLQSNKLTHFIMLLMTHHKLKQQYQILYKVLYTFQMVGTDSSIPLLTSTIPNLEATSTSFDLLINIFKINANGWMHIVLKLVINQSSQNRTLAHIHIAEKTNFYIFINIFQVLFGKLLVYSKVYGSFALVFASPTSRILLLPQTILTECMSTSQYHRLSIFVISHLTVRTIHFSYGSYKEVQIYYIILEYNSDAQPYIYQSRVFFIYQINQHLLTILIQILFTFLINVLSEFFCLLRKIGINYQQQRKV